jgi:hypothetical protein
MATLANRPAVIPARTRNAEVSYGDQLPGSRAITPLRGLLAHAPE